MAGRSRKTIRFAVVGLGHFAQTAILPAFQNTSRTVELAVMVTGDPEKAEKLSRKYQVPAVHYDQYDSVCGSGDIDAVYIALPNSHHREFTERAAQAGVHVLCEKPLAYSVEDAERMIAACEAADIRLMTAYRLHFEAGNLQAIKAVQQKKIGEARLFASIHTMQVDPDNIRVDLSLGGGPMEDIGIYCLNAARYLFQAEPLEVTAFAVHGSDVRFKEVPESVSVTLRFPEDRLATFLCGFGATKVSEYRVIGTEGVLRMDPAYTWHGDITQTITIGKRERTKTFRHRDQVAAEIDYFAKCIREETEPEPSGKEGLIDVKIIDAIRRSYHSRESVRIDGLPSDPRPKPSQSIRKKPPKKTKAVNASSPSRKG
jgi:predicted dehydrogenase